MANKFVTILEHVGKDILDVLTLGATVAKDLEPEVAILAPSISGLYNSAIALFFSAEASAGGVQGTGTQKLALAVQAIVPQFETWLTQNKISMSQDQITSWASALVDTLNLIPAPGATGTTPAVTTNTNVPIPTASTSTSLPL